MNKKNFENWTILKSVQRNLFKFDKFIEQEMCTLIKENLVSSDLLSFEQHQLATSHTTQTNNDHTSSAILSPNIEQAESSNARGEFEKNRETIKKLQKMLIQTNLNYREKCKLFQLKLDGLENVLMQSVMQHTTRTTSTATSPPPQNMTTLKRDENKGEYNDTESGQKLVPLLDETMPRSETTMIKTRMTTESATSSNWTASPHSSHSSSSQKLMSRFSARSVCPHRAVWWHLDRYDGGVTNLFSPRKSNNSDCKAVSTIASLSRSSITKSNAEDEMIDDDENYENEEERHEKENEYKNECPDECHATHSITHCLVRLTAERAGLRNRCTKLRNELATLEWHLAHIDRLHHRASSNRHKKSGNFSSSSCEMSCSMAGSNNNNNKDSRRRRRSGGGGGGGGERIPPLPPPLTVVLSEVEKRREKRDWESKEGFDYEHNDEQVRRRRSERAQKKDDVIISRQSHEQVSASLVAIRNELDQLVSSFESDKSAALECRSPTH